MSSEWIANVKCEVQEIHSLEVEDVHKVVEMWRWLTDMVKGDGLVYNRGRITAATASDLLAGENVGPGRLGGAGNGGLGGGEAGHMGRWQGL